MGRFPFPNSPGPRAKISKGYLSKVSVARAHRAEPADAAVRNARDELASAAMGRGFELPSGRVIALGRLLLASLFLAAISIDVTQPTRYPAATFALLIAYVAWAGALAIVAWRSWWLDARFAGPAHALDIVLFTVLVFLTDGYTSPYYVFFVFLLLAPAIRWGWRETALTALLLTLLYLTTGLAAATSGVDFQLYRFVIRAGQLIILSLIVIWFGINRWGPASAPAEEPAAAPAGEQSPLATALSAAMRVSGARRGAFLWRDTASGEVSGAAARGETIEAIETPALGKVPAAPALYDLERARALQRDARRNLQAAEPRALFGETAAALPLSEGIAIPVRANSGEGLVLLERIRALSTDHLDLAEQVAAEAASHIERRALLRAAEDSAEARSRLSLARDLHDSVVQFLAGAAFRLEAVKRAQASGLDVGPDLNELKQLMLEEQGELRSFVAALRSGSRVPLNDLAAELRALSGRLCKQWAIECTFSARAADALIPGRLHLDAQQLVREAVANAVRHAGAKSVSIDMALNDGGLRLDFVNDGAAYPRSSGGSRMPRSLLERVEEAGGTIDLSRGMGVTRLSIALPVAGARP